MNLSKLVNFYSPLNRLETEGFVMISGGREANWFAQMRLILETKFGDDPKQNSLCLCSFFVPGQKL